MDELAKQQLTDHLVDLRSCLIVSLLAVMAGFVGSYGFVKEIGVWFFKPLFEILPDQSTLIFVSYQEGFFFYLKLALAVGILLASPVIITQIWKFVAPGLYHHEKKVLLPFIVLSAFFFLVGVAFGYFIILPATFRFLVGYSTDFLQAYPAVSEYFSLTLRLLIAFGVIFELPILMVFLSQIGIVNVAFLNRHRKYAVLVNFIIAAVLTPTPDVINQLLMALPLIVLYEISVVAVYLFGRKKFQTFEDQGD